MNVNRNNSYMISSKGSSALVRTCTNCCPFDGQNLPHPFFNSSSMNNSDACCLSKLQVECRIQRPKKKRKRYHSSLSIKRSISSSNQIKRKKFHSNHDSDTQISSSSSNSTQTSNRSEQSFSSNQSDILRHQSTNAQPYDDNLQSLKHSIDNLTQLVLQQQRISPSVSRSFSFVEQFRRFFNVFNWFTQSKESSLLNEECHEILQRNHISKEHLRNIYQLFGRNESLFLNWLRTLLPESFLPFVLNYVKHFDSKSIDNN